MKKLAFAALWSVLAAQSLWMIVNMVQHHATMDRVLYPAVVTLAFAVLAITRGRQRWFAALLRIFIGIAFASAICDRLGVFGLPGTPGVSWGNFKNFTVYTGQVNSFLPAAVIPALAVLESVIEGALGLAMLLGAWVRISAGASSALLFLFGIAMTISLGAASQFSFAVFVLAAGAWVLTMVDSSAASVDGLLVRSRRAQTGAHA